MNIPVYAKQNAAKDNPQPQRRSEEIANQRPSIERPV